MKNKNHDLCNPTNLKEISKKDLQYLTFEEAKKALNSILNNVSLQSSKIQDEL